MREIPTKVRKALFVTAILVGSLLVFGGYFYWQLTADFNNPALEGANSLDASEAKRKFKLLEGALTNAQRGFVRLSETEINSYLAERYQAGATNSDPRLIKCRLDLGANEVIVYCWVQKKVWGQEMELFWQRHFAVKHQKDGRMAFELTQMHLGNQELPKALWPHLQQSLGKVDSVFREKWDWLQSVPAFDILTNQASRTPEIQLFSYKPERKVEGKL